MERLFKIKARGSSIGNEVTGGFTTFLAMAYIVAVNPGILLDAGVPFTAGLTATCFGAAIMTILMGLIANRPIALASSMGVNAIVAYSLCQGYGVDWRVAMAVVMIEGILILLLVLCGLRKAIMDAIPVGLRHAIGIGIGLFVAFIGLQGGGLIVDDGTTLVAIGDLAAPTSIVALVSILIAIVLYAVKFKGGLIVSIVVATIIAVPLGVATIPVNWNFGLDFSAFAAPFQIDPSHDTLAIVRVIVQPTLLLVMLSLLMTDFFDTMGTIVAVGGQGNFVDEDGNVDNVQEILLIDSAAAAVGGFIGASSITCYVESTSGAAVGARTGFSNIVVGLLFLLCAFLSPLFGMIPSAATCGALVVVGFLMMKSIGEIDWTKIESAFPAFLTIVMIPFTYSITNGIGAGFIAYVLIMVCKGKIAEIKPLMWVAALAFVALFIFG